MQRSNFKSYANLHHCLYHEEYMSKSAIIIGSGFGGLGSACLLARAGWDVTVLEKNEQIGGRAGTFTEKKFTFDTGPSWYLMPDVFEHFFELLGEDIHKHLKLKKLSPSYRVFYKDTFLKADLHADRVKDRQTLELMEAGGADKLDRYLEKAERRYVIAKDRFMYKNYDSLKDFMTPEMVVDGSKLRVLGTMDKHVRRHFKTGHLQKLMQYPMLFLGTSPYKAPALYSIMNHVDFNMGAYYPMGGMYEVVKALQGVAEKHGAKFRVSSGVKRIVVKNGRAKGVILENGNELRADIVISNADIHHTETKLFDKAHRTKSERYWTRRTMAPSALLMYLGVKGDIKELSHHNLLFSKNWKSNFKDIFAHKRWPRDPSFYVCMPSATDSSVAPKGHENLFVLVPIAAGLTYDQAFLDRYADKILASIEKDMYVKDLRKRIVYKRLFSVKDFEQQFNSYKGSALGLAHTLKQTAIFRPNNISSKVRDFYYVGANTNPGIGIPPALISAELMYKRLMGDTSPGPLRPDQLFDE